MSAGEVHKRGWIAQKNYMVLFVVMFALPIMSHAGGLGIAAIVALGTVFGLIGFRPPHPRDIPKTVPMAIWMLMLMLVWGLFSSLWSPYETTDTLSNADKILVGVPLFLGCAAMLVGQNKYTKNALPWMLVVVTFGSIAAILIDLLTDYSLTMLVDPLAEGETMGSRQGDMVQNVGHAVSVLVLLAVPVGGILWQKGSLGRLATVLMVVLIGFATYKANASAAQLGLIVGLLFVGLATLKPKFALNVAFLMAGAVLLFAPLLAFISARMSADMRAKLPFSWEERVVNWDTLYDKIWEHPFIGHGFDAVRTFTETHSIRGFEGRALVSLHPHNAGLHLWIEVGFIGVLLACLALYSGARRLTGAGGLSRPQLISASGFCAATTVMASLSYGVWQDWWWASIIFIAATIAFIKPTAK